MFLDNFDKTCESKLLTLFDKLDTNSKAASRVLPY